MSNRLPILSNEVVSLHQQLLEHQSSAAENALLLGEALTEAKALCRHGQWSGWLNAAFIPERSAQRYMLLHRSGLKPATLADLGTTLAERYATIGLRLWPGEGQATIDSFADHDGPHGFAIWWRLDKDRLHYRKITVVPNVAEVVCVEPQPLLPWQLGVFQADTLTFDSRTVETVAEADARALHDQIWRAAA